MCHFQYDICIPSIFYDHAVVNVRSASEHPLTALSHKISSNADKIRRILFGIMKVKLEWLVQIWEQEEIWQQQEQQTMQIQIWQHPHQKKEV